MKFKVTGFSEIDGRKYIRIDATRTDWNDIPYQDKNGNWHNEGKFLHVAMLWLDDPIAMGKMLNAGLQQLLYYLESGESPSSN